LVHKIGTIKWRCIAREPGLDITVGKIYLENEFGYIIDDTCSYDISQYLNKDIFEKVEG